MVRRWGKGGGWDGGLVWIYAVGLLRNVSSTYPMSEIGWIAVWQILSTSTGKAAIKRRNGDWPFRAHL